MLVCPQDFEGQYDLKNSPQNKVPRVKDNPAIRNPRPDTGGRSLTWNTASTKWDETERLWQQI